MSMLTRAAKRFDERFAALPKNVQSAVALAMWRAAPALQQYHRDLAPLAEDEGMLDAVWDLLVASGWQMAKKGRAAAFSPKVLDELAKAAPHAAEFFARVTAMIEGAFTGRVGLDPSEEPTPPMLPARTEREP